MRIVFLTAAILAALTFAACGDDDDDGIGDDATSQPTATTDGSGTGGGANIELVAADFQFAPATLNLAAGETYSITLINTGQARHGFAIDDLNVAEETEGGAEITFDFTAPSANAEFYCQFHPDTMVGSIIIGGSAGGTTSPPVATFPLATETTDDADGDDDDNSGPGGGDDDDDDNGGSSGGGLTY